MCEKCADAFAKLAKEAYIKSEGVAVIVSVEEIRGENTIGIHHRDNMTHEQGKGIIAIAAAALVDNLMVERDVRLN